jgi:hypothetical protein
VRSGAPGRDASAPERPTDAAAPHPCTRPSAVLNLVAWVAILVGEHVPVYKRVRGPPAPALWLACPPRP